MRLTDELFRRSDSYHAELVSHALCLAAVGRYGLLPSARSFSITLDINGNGIEVVALSCLGLTKGGQLVDIMFDSSYSEERGCMSVILPQSQEAGYLLLVDVTDQWKEVGDDTCEPLWQFSLLAEGSPIPDSALPVARIVNEMGWREDDLHFVPPCLLLSSHERFTRLCNNVHEEMRKMEQQAFAKLVTDSGDARKLFWPEVRRLAIVIDKEADVMTPASLFARVQECVSAFHCACTIDESLELTEADSYAEFVRRSYNHVNGYAQIEDGLSLLRRINQKLEDFAAPCPREAKTIVAPNIRQEDLHVKATSNNVRIEVFGLDGAQGLFSIDGSDPDRPLQGGRFVSVNPGFNKSSKSEADKEYVVKLKSVKDGNHSRVATFNLVVTKDVRAWNGYQI